MAGPQKPVIAVTLGDPAGIGPEVVVKALSDGALRGRATFRIYGTETPLLAAAASARIAPFWERVEGDEDPRAIRGEAIALVGTPGQATRPGKPSATGGQDSFEFVEAAIGAAKRAPGDPLRVDAIVTAPISKTAWSMAGVRDFPGHTELLAARFESPRSGMLFVGSRLRVMLVTIHEPLRTVAGLITPDRVFDAIDLGAGACRWLGVERPRVAVCGVNPHAGEGGMFGDEDDRLVRPGVDRARGAGIDATGPLPADGVFAGAARGAYDLVVAMYHDQGLIPIKSLEREQTVNMTVGLLWKGRRVIRTSPAHGTAFDIAGRNTADPASMRAATELAVMLAGRPDA